MPDVWATVAEQDEATQKRLVEVLETRGADPKQQELRKAFLDDIHFPREAILEVGCGTGVLTRRLAEWPNVGEVIGVDIAGALLAAAAELAADFPNVSFTEADARALPFGAESVDLVVFDSTLTHVPRPEEALAEAFRVLRPRGLLAAFEGDYSTTTVALGADDPLQACVDPMLSGSVHDLWIVRRLPRLVRACGFEMSRLRSFGYVDRRSGRGRAPRGRPDRGRRGVCAEGGGKAPCRGRHVVRPHRLCEHRGRKAVAPRWEGRQPSTAPALRSPGSHRGARRLDFPRCRASVRSRSETCRSGAARPSSCSR
jgi:ubiquinone/menaquinone biosynthesis C-methylase UbiE